MNSNLSLASRLNHGASAPVCDPDEAYTLAFYLTGDEEKAFAMVQAALSRPGSQRRQGQDARLEQLRRVALVCLEQSSPAVCSRPQPGDGPAARLMRLARPERAAAVLVDVLGLDYHQAGQVLGCSPRQAGRLLARARYHLTRELVL